MTTSGQNLKFNFEILRIWQNLCEYHHDLFQLTCDEYQHLLKSEIEQVEVLLERKNEIIQNIQQLESDRNALVLALQQSNPEFEKITVKNLIKIAKQQMQPDEFQIFLGFNQLLIDIIEKLKHQGKMNQIFINKSLASLESLRNESLGKKNYPTYSLQGLIKPSTTFDVG